MTDTTKKETEISSETSKRICAHMNQDHVLSVYAMAKHAAGQKWPGKGSKVHLRNVTMRGCQIQIIYCPTELMCQEEKVVYLFKPPLSDPSQVRSRMVSIHHYVCRPYDMYTNPLAYLIAVGVLFVTFLSTLLGVEGMMAEINSRDWLAVDLFQPWQVEPVFVAQAIRFLFFVTVVAHAVEAMYVLYHSRNTLKFSWTTTIFWCLVVGVAGFPCLGEFQELLDVHQKSKQQQNEQTKGK